MSGTTEETINETKPIAPEAIARMRELVDAMGVTGLATARRALDRAARAERGIAYTDLRLAVDLIEALGVGLIVGDAPARADGGEGGR